MSNVRLTIGGRKFLVACAEGEEGHVAELGRMLDGKIRATQDVANLNEPRVLLYAALLLADELFELKQTAKASPPPPSASDTLAETLAAIAERMENLASRLESEAASA